MKLHDLFFKINPKGHVLDVGCFGFQQYNTAMRLGLKDIKHSGVDYCEIKGEIPPGYTFKNADLNRDPIPFPDDSFDLVVASHILEHLFRPIDFIGECVRVCRPGGYLYVEAPSERSLLLPGMPFERDSFFSWSFFDDPTHGGRPWTPQSYHRLSRYYSCEPVEVGYCTSLGNRVLFPFRLLKALLTRDGKLLELSTRGAIGWASYLVMKKPENIKGKPEFYYYIPQDR